MEFRSIPATMPGARTSAALPMWADKGNGSGGNGSLCQSSPRAHAALIDAIDDFLDERGGAGAYPGARPVGQGDALRRVANDRSARRTSGRNGAAMTAPARVGVRSHPLRSTTVPHVRSHQQRGSLLWEMAPVLGVIAARYPDVSDQMIRQQAIEVLSAAQGNRVTAALLARLVEARVIALL
jgi:hypothetical protein